MKDLAPLIRMHKLQVDERQRNLSELRNLEDRMRQERLRLEDELRHEQQVAGSTPINAMTYAGFARQVIQRRARLDDSIAQVRHAITQAEEELADAFRELKKYEIIQEERQRQRAENRKRLQAQMLDEVASTRFQRAKDADS